MKEKTILRREWRGIYARSYAETRFEEGPYHGIAGLLYMDDADDFCVRTASGPLRITCPGYSWPQLAPEGKNVWATVMFDEKGSLFQCYFDITLENRVLDGAGSGFTDLFLDVVIRPETDEASLFDESELLYACRVGEIDFKTRDMAYLARERLLSFIHNYKTEFFDFCRAKRLELLPRLEKVNEG